MSTPPTPPASNRFNSVSSKLLPEVRSFWTIFFAWFVANAGFNWKDVQTWSFQHPYLALPSVVVVLVLTIGIEFGAHQSKPANRSTPIKRRLPEWAKWVLLGVGGVAMALWVYLIPVSSTTIFFTLIPQEVIALLVFIFSIIQIRRKTRHQPGPSGASGLPPTNPPNKP